MLSKLKSSQSNFSSLRPVGLGLLILCFFFTPQMGLAIDIADVPMASKIQKPPPNIMFVLDNSGSMNVSFMVPGTYEGYWRNHNGGTSYYVFDDPGDHNYGGVLPWAYRGEWQSQWSGMNTVFYDPQIDYKPWPLPDQDLTVDGIERMANADTTNPISNPFFLIDGNSSNDNYTLNLTDVYYEVGSGNPPITVDDLDGEPSFTMTGSLWHFTADSVDFNNHAQLMYTSSGATGTFTPTIPAGGGEYEVYVYNACHTDMDTNAEYTITQGNGISRTLYFDQDANCGKWTQLGTVPSTFSGGTSNHVSVSRHSGSTHLHTYADAIRFSPTGGQLIEIYNAHYYTQQWDDSNGDGVEDPDELTTYLVNFNSGTREVYRVNDLNADNFIDPGELVFFGNELPDPIRPALYDDDGNFVGYRDAANELQNFANWYSFYRRREMAAKAAVAEVIANTSGVNIGFYSLHDHNGGITRQPVLHVQVPGEANGTNTLLSHLYQMNSWGGTPLRTALRNVGRYFDDTDGNSGGIGESPYYHEDDGGGCQHSFAIVMTDGFWNGGHPGVGNTDEGEGEPYADTYSNTLADVAMYYYKRDLSSLPDQHPTTSCDLNTAQHMVTFSVSFGLEGTIDMEDMDGNNVPDSPSYEDDPCFLDENTPHPTWPKIVAGRPSTIDDLWHAAVNGRGEFFSASNPQELVTALTEIIGSIESMNRAGAAVSIDGEVLSSDTRVFAPSFDSATWTGDLKAVKFDEDGNLPYNDKGLIPDSAILWKASTKLMSLNWDTGRNIVTINNTGNGIPFRWTSLSATQKNLLENNVDVLNYIRGNNHISGFRVRVGADMSTENILGDIVHSSPALSDSGNTVFVGANDGMLHAFNANTGEERFAYIPNLVYANLPGLKDPVYDHRFFVDATPSIWSGVGSDERTVLVGGLGKGGKGYYALNVTHADDYGPGEESGIANTVPMWEFPAPGSTDPDMGYSFSKPFIVKSNATGHGWVVIFGNGYNSTNGHAVLYVVDAITGALVKKIDTNVGGDNGLSTPGLVDLNLDYQVDVVYAGDLKGNMWKFDLSKPNTDEWAVDFSGNALFTATGPATNVDPQPITTKPAVMKHPTRHGLMVLFGTGKFLGESDRTNTDVQSLYGIWDFNDRVHPPAEFLGTFNRNGLGNLGGNIELLAQTIVFQDNFASDESALTTFGTDGTDGTTAKHLLRVTSDNEINWEVQDGKPDPSPDNPPSHAGWFFDMDEADTIGERVLEDPLIRDGRLIAVTTIPDSSYCAGGGWSIINEFDAKDGSRPDSPAFDVTGAESDGKILVNASDQIKLTEGGEVKYVAATGILKPGGGILHLSESSIIELPGQGPKLEKKILSSSSGKNVEIVERAPRRGITFWREH
ncbi:MAG: hypothetical protein CSA20_02825 [Deltaproteobacteria bacterium]|nr:MAG: hypothetical protein CSA20_02825 [Deltaproteobacteria bacterium]